ncbi:hypothetical protein [Bacillus sp. BS98]|uniref:hypothetical protein n=1 Tax=Bacillus sp. BS98 TaxID=2608254 RepID=UPI00122EB470|nr:hypothetical protein [Bacillus sp. BS98]QEQ20452.1 hypothetical protein F0362_28260 [Bacillus sp. BS98]
MTNPFPSPYKNLLSDDPILGLRLNAAVAEGLLRYPILNPFGVAISFVAINETTNPKDFTHAGIRFGDSFYTASLVKMGVLYAAYELLSSVNKIFAESGVPTPNEMYSRLHQAFDKIITEKFLAILQVAEIKLTPVNEKVIKPPKYEQIFIPSTTGGRKVTFRPQFQDHLQRMIIKGDNNSAAACIEALGYCWINGTLSAGGFFFPKGKTGIWVGGTFTGSLPPIRIPTVNDGENAQASTCFDMATLYAHIFQRSLVDDTSSFEMGKLLSDSANIGDDSSWLDFNSRGLPTRNFTVTGSKIGHGPLKSRNWVASEGAVIKRKLSDNTERKFIVVFQNSLDNNDALAGLGYIVDRTIDLILSGP